MLTIGILCETEKNESRVALTPDLISKYQQLGCDIFMEHNAGKAADFPDSAYQGVTFMERDKIVQSVDCLLSVKMPHESVLQLMKKDALLVCLLNPYRADGGLKHLAAKQISALSLELIPRITRAQSMDILSSQANLAGYKAVIEAAQCFARAFPMMMTAAGTIAPARVFVMGAGVAGLQAIATARRLGAIVSATDVRPAAKEQVQSLGASFVMVESDEVKEAETAGGYAKEMSEEFKKAQAALIASTIPKQDIIITTALIPGRPAPQLVTQEMVESMKPGSVIVDLAAEQGGNCALTKPDEHVMHQGVHIIGHRNWPSLIAQDASRLFAKNVYHLMAMIIKDKKIELQEEDEIIKAILMTKNGEIVQERFRG